MALGRDFGDRIAVSAETTGTIVFMFSSLGYLGLTVLLVRGWDRRGPGIWLIGAAAMTTAWAVFSAIYYTPLSPLPPTAIQAMDVVRSAAWIAVLGRLLIRLRESVGTSRNWLRGVLVIAVGAGAALAAHYLAIVLFGQPLLFDVVLPVSGSYLSHLILAVCGLLLVENLYRNSSPENRWGVQLFCIGVGGAFVFDILLYSQALMFRGYDEDLFIARGAISIMVVPLIAVAAARNPAWKLDVFVSRRMVFHTVSLIGTGTYLLLISAAGYYFREVGGDWGTLLQVTFLFGAALALLVALVSGKVRARIRVFLNKHFFSYNYDYREEWLKFLSTVSARDQDMPLQVRVIKAVCDIMDSPGGQLWLARGNEGYRPVNRWNFPRAREGVERAHSPLVKLMTEQNWIVEVTRPGAGLGGSSLKVPVWAEGDERYWLAVPLLHHAEMIGFLVLERPRSERALNWEDYDILRTVGRHAASYLAEEESMAALAEARQFDTFNKRFAFVMHDLKNLVSQLSLITRNAEKHRDNPKFQADMLATVQESVDKMKMLLERMNERSDISVRAEDFDLNGLMMQVVGAMGGGSAKLTFAPCDDGLWVAGERARIESVFRHLIQNGLEAVREDGSVGVTASMQGDQALVEVRDDGCGMDADFVRDELFRPFRSTKSKGYGIGAFESKQIVSEHGGRMEVESVPGQGTTFQVYLPLSRRSMAQSRGLSAVEGQ